MTLASQSNSWLPRILKFPNIIYLLTHVHKYNNSKSSINQRDKIIETKMSAEKEATMVFIPFPVMSHLVAAVKMAKLLADQDQRLSITVLIMKLPFDTKISSYIKNSPNSRINFVELQGDKSTFADLAKSPQTVMRTFIESQRGPAKDAVSEILESRKSDKIAGFVLDMFCTAMVDVANDFSAPAYVFFTCGAASLGLMLHLQNLSDDENWDLTEYEHSDAEISVPTYVNPVPASVWPTSVFVKEIGFTDFIRRFRECKGIIVNSFLELESHAFKSLAVDKKIPPVFPVGPILQDEGQKNTDIIEWLDDQPDSSVVFICFGSRGCFQVDQVKEIAIALENSGHRFLWSLRKPHPEEQMDFPGEYEDPGEALPSGFLQRTAAIGKVIGWAPQMAVLSHPAVGGFVSHCGWNSTLESVWFGVPMAVWPLAAEQQANAFQFVNELEIAVEIKMDYRRNCDVIVPSEKIEMAVRELMDPENEIRVKVKSLKEKSREAVREGGSSYNFLHRLIDDILVENSS